MTTVTLSSYQEDQLRQVFKHFNRFMVSMWKMGLGKWINGWPDVGGRIMVIVHKGRKTGQTRYAPVNYALVDGELYCVAGFGKGTDWYRNVKVNPEVDVWLPDGGWAGVVTDVTSDPRRLALLRQVLINSGFAARMVGLEPKTMSDADLAAATESYRLLHISRTEPRPTPQMAPGPIIALSLGLLSFLVLLWWKKWSKRRLA
ncbi:MAG: nitroreductase family deazaflavin-dependent oxidoreductase [Chloroflexi bacterium]|nr:nitroreductase family deazaflavin-dependent oxidoreductase [Chloroflexota bacterium]MBP8055696.1 nitroreductase family deazaflavin-dependent oxidoreductase [Chloroflexota bacterium]